MELYDATFLLAFIVAMGILFFKIYNSVRLGTGGPAYKFPGAVISTIAFFIAWFVCLVVTLHEPSETLFSTLLSLLNWCLLLNILMFIVEIFLTMKEAGEQPIRAYAGPVSVRPYSPAFRK